MAITLIILGSSFAIMFSLAAVALVFFVIVDEYPRVRHEISPLLSSLVVFTVMTGISGLSFYGLWKTHKMRHWAQAGMWVGVLLTAYYYWS